MYGQRVAWVEGLKVSGEPTPWGTDVGDALRFENVGDGYVVNCWLESHVRGPEYAEGQGGYAVNHSDALQNLGADRITISGSWLQGNYHAMYLPDDVAPYQDFELRVDHTQFLGLETPAEYGGLQGPNRMIWWTGFGGEATSVTFGDEVYLVNQHQGDWGGFNMMFDVTPTVTNGVATWPNHPTVTGQVINGIGPPRASNAGIGYTTTPTPTTSTTEPTPTTSTTVVVPTTSTTSTTARSRRRSR